MMAQNLEHEEQQIRREIAKKLEEQDEQQPNDQELKKRRRWESDTDTPLASKSQWDAVDATPKHSAASAETPVARSRWDMTPAASDATPSTRANRWDQTPQEGGSGRAKRWDETPLGDASSATPSKKRSRWDETPLAAGQMTPSSTPLGDGMMTPSAYLGPMTPEMAQRLRWDREVEEGNRPLSDEELDSIFPPTGYKILDPPVGYQPVRTPQRKMMATPTPMPATPGLHIQHSVSKDANRVPATSSESQHPFIKPQHYHYFCKRQDELH